MILFENSESNAAILCPHYNQTANRKNGHPPSPSEKKRERYLLARSIDEENAIFESLRLAFLKGANLFRSVDSTASEEPLGESSIED